MVSLPRFGSLWAFGPSAHRAHASLRACRGLGQRPKPCAAAQKSERCECPKGTRNAPRSTPPRISAQTARPSSTRRGRAASISKNIIIGKTRVSRVPSVARNARRALPPEALASSRVFLHQAAFLAPFGRSQRSRLLLRQRFLGRCPKPRQGPEAPAPHSFPLHPYLTTLLLSLRISSVTPSGGSPNVALSVLLPPSHVSCIAISRASIRQPSSTTVTTSPTS